MFPRPVALQNRKIPFLCGRRLLLKSPLTAARRAIKDILGVFLGLRNKSDSAGNESKDALYFDCIVYAT